MWDLFESSEYFRLPHKLKHQQVTSAKHGCHFAQCANLAGGHWPEVWSSRARPGCPRAGVCIQSLVRMHNTNLGQLELRHAGDPSQELRHRKQKTEEKKKTPTRPTTHQRIE
jgi:hypothetical protein